MATYKVLQDIEAEDHILGPLTLRQFIYALIAVFCLYLCFISLTKHAVFLLAIFLPPAIFTGFFAFPFRQDQPTEVWALAKIRFLLKPHRRIWDQSGVKELVTITVPKKEERNFTNGLSQIEVKSRLKALADTIDSRGWAIKNVNVNLYSQPALISGGTSDRLIDIDNMPQEVPSYDVNAFEDILDERVNPVAQQFDQMISASSQAHRQQLMDSLNETRAQTASSDQKLWFTQSAAQPPTPSDQRPSVASTINQPADNLAAAEESVITHELKTKSQQPQVATSHLKTIRPINQTGAPQGAATPSPAAPDPAILNLASNNDLNVATIARQAHKAKRLDGDSDEVVVSLH